MSFTKEFIITYSTQIYIYFLTLISSIITARVLGPAGKGQLAVLLAVYSTVIQFTAFGIGAGILYKSSKSKKESRVSAVTAVLFSLLNGITAFLILWFLGITKSPIVKHIPFELLFWVSLSAPLSFFANYSSSILLGRQKIKEMNIIRIVYETFRVGSLFLLALLGILDVAAAVFLTIATTIINFIFSAAFIKKKVGFSTEVTYKHLKETVSIGLKAFSISIISFLLLRSDIILLNIYRPASAVGIYSISVAMTDILQGFSATAGSLLTPRAIKDVEAVTSFQMKVSRFISLITVFLILLAAAFAYPAINLLYGEEFLPSYLPFLILLPGIYFLSIGRGIGSYYIAKKYPTISFAAPGAALVVNVLLNIILIPYFGYYAAAFTSTLAYSIFYFIYFWDYRKNTGATFLQLTVPRVSEVGEFARNTKSKIRRRLAG